MRSRFSIWRFNYRDIQRKANRRLGKSPDEAKFRLADIFFLAAFFMMSFDVPLDKVEFLAEVEHITELRIILAVVLYIVGLVLAVLFAAEDTADICLALCSRTEGSGVGQQRF